VSHFARLKSAMNVVASAGSLGSGEGTGAAVLLLHFARARLSEALRVGLRVDGWPQVNREGPDVGGENEGDDPLKVGSNILVASRGQDAKGNDEEEFEEDEGELDPEGSPKHAISAVLCEISVSARLSMSRNGKSRRHLLMPSL
jgi:hypothetical protein